MSCEGRTEQRRSGRATSIPSASGRPAGEAAGGDVVRDFVEPCRRYGIAPGLYTGIRFNAWWQVYNYEVCGGKGGDPARRAEYMRVCERMVEELCTRYGPLCEIWFDGGVLTPEENGPDGLSIVKKHQPDAVIYHSRQCARHRWAGSETGAAGCPCWSAMPDVAALGSAFNLPAVLSRPTGDPFR